MDLNGLWLDSVKSGNVPSITKKEEPVEKKAI
jgi:hypothetical protein